MANCVNKGKEDLSNCKKFRDDGYERCDKYEDQGYNSCDRWDDECCDWWPCSWGCKLITWICVAWTWISNVVCVFAVWVSHKVCIAWAFIVYIACTVVDTLATGLAAIVDALEAVFGWFLSLFAWFIDLVLSIPIIGRLIKSIWNGILTIYWGAASVVDAIGYLVGIRAEKKLRVCTLLLCDEQGNDETFTKRAHVVDELNKAIAVFQQAHVRIIPSRPLQFRSGFSGSENADDSWITRYCASGGNDKNILEVDCGVGGGLADLWTTGSQLQFVLDTNCFFGNYRRLLGYGAPVTIFVIRDVGGDDAGGCGSVLWDYVTVEVKPLSTFEGGNQVARTIAHELGHACNLTHIDLSGNLMQNDQSALATATDLTFWQQMLIRMSRHVTYL